MTSLIPVVVKVLLIATMIEITNMVESNSVMANIKLLKMLLTEWLIDPVAVIAIKKIPIIQMREVSLLITIKPIMSAIKTTKIQCSDINSTPIKILLYSLPLGHSPFLGVLHNMKFHKIGEKLNQKKYPSLDGLKSVLKNVLF